MKPTEKLKDEFDDVTPSPPRFNHYVATFTHTCTPHTCAFTHTIPHACSTYTYTHAPHTPTLYTYVHTSHICTLHTRMHSAHTQAHATRALTLSGLHHLRVFTSVKTLHPKVLQQGSLRTHHHKTKGLLKLTFKFPPLSQ